MRVYRVSYYNTDCEGRVPFGTEPTEKYFMSKEKANTKAEEMKNNWWVAEVSIEEIEIIE